MSKLLTQTILALSNQNAAYLSKNEVDPEEMDRRSEVFLRVINAELEAMGSAKVIEGELATDTPTIAGPEREPKSKKEIDASINDEYLISFFDNRKMKQLKSHIAKRGHTPQSYREYFGLPDDYPMVAAATKRRRSEVALKAGLGQKGRKKAPSLQDSVEWEDAAPRGKIEPDPFAESEQQFEAVANTDHDIAQQEHADRPHYKREPKAASKKS
ncbi:MucR family transcriptional regulator [Aureimonas altamirensis]|uniref:MucR family transcriptional regulator n=1 Tax=Aureimonas altamirensis TaxID=370622 RepID=UPI002036D408|nr:MucR family transcriptional regulator [Aureimonas altamirensis]MCM2503072.1 MucR family transcriptional regulator [Aureimonas altamirensis]